VSLDWAFEFLAYPAVNFCTVLWIKVIMTNDSEHDSSPSFNVPISILFWEDDLCVAFRVKSNRPFEFQKRSQLFIGPCKETRSIAMRVNNPDRSPVLRDPHLNPQAGIATGEERREADAKAPVRVEFGIDGMALIPSAPLKLARLPACSLLPSSLYLLCR
jgi:hypothetical protein